MCEKMHNITYTNAHMFFHPSLVKIKVLFWFCFYVHVGFGFGFVFFQSWQKCREIGTLICCLM